MNRVAAWNQMLTGLTCPGCGASAEITERFTLASTDGPVAHVAVSCAGGHHYRMAAEKLPASVFGPLVPRPRVVLGPGRLPHTFQLCMPSGHFSPGQRTGTSATPGRTDTM